MRPPEELTAPEFRTRAGGFFGDEILDGTVVRLRDCAAGARLAARARTLLARILTAPDQSETDPRDFQFLIHPDEFLQRVDEARAAIRADATIHRLVAELFGATACAGMRFDAVRLRAVQHGAHVIPAAAPAYYVHRDTWYANSPAQWNWWLPVYDVEPAQGFAIFPEYFRRPVDNDSGEFDLADWEASGGFQARSPIGRVFPRAKCAEFPAAVTPAEYFLNQDSISGSGPAGSVVIFAAAHLHGTLPNLSGRTRFSLEIRTVRDADLALGRRAPDPDNRSRGSTLASFRRAPDLIPQR